MIIIMKTIFFSFVMTVITCLISEYGESFLESQLKPVAYSHSVSAPVVEVFVTDDA